MNEELKKERRKQKHEDVYKGRHEEGIVGMRKEAGKEVVDMEERKKRRKYKREEGWKDTS